MPGVVSIADASSLGWVAMISSVATEVRAVGLVALGLAITMAGIRFFFRQRLDDLGETVTAFSVGGAFVGTGLTIAGTLLGFTAASPAAGLVAPTPPFLESLASALSLWAWQGPLFVGSMALWRRLRRG